MFYSAHQDKQTTKVNPIVKIEFKNETMKKSLDKMFRVFNF